MHPARDARYMARALRLARRAQGRTGPNPLVGAVVVAGWRIVGEGYHRRAGGPHAEVLALQQAGPRARGGTLYLTLEPCCHTAKRTPPCVPGIIASGVRRVVVAMRDPNPQVNGRGLRALRRAGIAVVHGCLEAAARRLNRAYVHRMTTGRPWVILKAGMTVDGQIATAAGESQWITGPGSRRDAHRLRARVDAVMVGIGTILADDPALTARTGRSVERQPVRVVVDSRLRLPVTARVLHVKGGRVIVVTTARAPSRKRAQLRALGAEVVVVPADRGRVAMEGCVTALADRGVLTVLLEGGSELNASALGAGIISEVRLYIAPLLLGGADARGVIGGRSPRRLHEGSKLDDVRLRSVGPDYVLTGLVTPA